MTTFCPIPEVADSAAPCEHGRLAHGYRNFDNYRLRMLLAASGNRTRRVRTERP